MHAYIHIHRERERELNDVIRVSQLPNISLAHIITPIHRQVLHLHGFQVRIWADTVCGINSQTTKTTPLATYTRSLTHTYIHIHTCIHKGMCTHTCLSSHPSPATIQLQGHNHPVRREWQESARGRDNVRRRLLLHARDGRTAKLLLGNHFTSHHLTQPPHPPFTPTRRTNLHPGTTRQASHCSRNGSLPFPQPEFDNKRRFSCNQPCVIGR